LNSHILDYDELYYRTHYGYLCDDAYYRRLSLYYKRFWFEGVEADDVPIFEYGCGLGVNVAWSDRAHGYDISEQARKFSRSKGIHVYDSMRDAPSGFFPLAVSSHCLEHVDDPLSILLEIKRVLTPGGKLILAVPKEKHRRSSFQPDGDAHLYSWTFRTINNLLLRCGFRILSNSTVWGPTGLKKLAPLEHISPRLYLKTVHALGRTRNNLPTLKVKAVRPS